MDLEHQEYEKYIEIVDQVAIVSKTDIKGNIIYVNNYFEEVSGYTHDELIGQPHNIIRHPDTPAMVFQELWDTIQGGNMWEGKLKNMTKDGGYYITIATVYPIYDDNESNNKTIIEYMSVRFLITAEEDNQARFRDKIGKSMIGFRTKIKETTTNIKDLSNLLLKKDANKKYIDKIYKGTILKYKEGIHTLRTKHVETTNSMKRISSKNIHLENNLDLIIKNQLAAKDKIIKIKDNEIAKQKTNLLESNELLDDFKSTIEELKTKIEDLNSKKAMAEKLLEASTKQSKKRLDVIENLEKQIGKR